MGLAPAGSLHTDRRAVGMRHETYDAELGVALAEPWRTKDRPSGVAHVAPLQEAVRVPDDQALPYRVKELERAVDDLNTAVARLTTTITTHEEQISGQGGLRAAINSLSEDVRSLRRVIIGFAITVAGSAVVFAFATLAGGN
jgi:hypothetical protein